MKYLLFWAGAIALALLSATPAAAQFANCEIHDAAGACIPGYVLMDPATRLPYKAAGDEAAATSTAQLGSVTSATATATSGTATIAAGVATIGPLAPQLGRSIRVLLKGTWAGTVFVGTSADACATINPLTIGGQPWASFTGNANEDIDTPHIAGIVYCARATITSGTLTYAVRQ